MGFRQRALIHVRSLTIGWDPADKHVGVPDNANYHVGDVKIVEGDLEDPKFWGTCGRAISSQHQDLADGHIGDIGIILGDPKIVKGMRGNAFRSLFSYRHQILAGSASGIGPSVLRGGATPL